MRLCLAKREDALYVTTILKSKSFLLIVMQSACLKLISPKALI